MTMTENQTCSCGCSSPGMGTADQPCGCGCGSPAVSIQDEIADLRRVLADVDARLAALGDS